MTNSLYYTRTEAAKILGVSNPTITNLTRNGMLKAVIIPAGKGKRYFFLKEDIDRMHDNRQMLANQ